MSTYRIESKAGLVFGEYEGETPEQAFAAMVADGGPGNEGTIEDWIVREVSDLKTLLDALETAEQTYSKAFAAVLAKAKPD
jgi:hypothetical protein